MLRERDLSFYPHQYAGAIWRRLSDEDSASAVWLWAPAQVKVYPAGLDTINGLTAAGWERTPVSLSSYVSQSSEVLYHLWDQLAVICTVETPGRPDDIEIWARSSDLRRAEAVPVALGFTVPLELQRYVTRVPPGRIEVLRMAEALPPPQLGEFGMVSHERTPGEPQWHRYSLAELGEDARALQHRLGDAVRELAGTADWWPLTDALLKCATPGYERAKRDLQSRLLATHGTAHDDVHVDLEALEEANAQYQALLRAHSWFSPETWIERWEGIQRMAQNLADAYWQTHTQLTAEQHEGRARSLQPLTSAHRTFLPSHNAPRALWQTFGPGVQPSLWNLDPTARTIELQTPNQSLVTVTPQEGPELPILHRHVNEGLTPEGVKHALGVIAAYADQTGGVDQKADARVALRQLLLRMGKPESHADDLEEQARLYRTILYLARCLVHASDRPEDPRPPGSARRRKGREYRDYSPMLVLERVQFEHDGSLRIPREVTFHLGADYYHLLFGQGRSYFTIPTALVLSYHPDREQQELLLALYLSDMLAWNSNPWHVTFHTLLLQSALRSEDELTQGVHRLRDAMRVLLALERLERDGLLLRDAHTDIDTALACELALGNITSEDLAEATRKRLAEPPYRTLTAGAEPALVRERRRRALQRLLGVADSLTLSAGPLLREQVHQREAKRKEAAERNERALTARVAKNAAQKIVDAAQGTGQPGSVNAGAKRRGRPRKY